MKRLHIFIFILTITLNILLTLTLVSWYYSATAPSYYGSSWMGQMWGSHLGGKENNWGMGGMMGNGSGTTPSYLWIIPVILIVIVSAALIGVGFYYVFPELKYIRGSCNPRKIYSTQGSINNASDEDSFLPVVETSAIRDNCEIMLKTMTEEEQKVFMALLTHKGKYLQKYLVKETGLSRLKTHRIVARFAQRGIVTVKEFGNTNEVELTDWVKNSSSARLP
jgi:hypothetical protein